MEFLNNYPETVFWRVFKADDTSYALGWKEGTIAPGKIGVFREDQFMQMKVEIRKGTNYTAPWLQRPGQLWDMTSKLVVDPNGKLSEAAVATVDGALEQQTREQVEFVNLLQTDNGTTQEKTFEVSTVFSSGHDMKRSHENSTTWTVGAKVGGEIGKNDAKVSAEISAEFQKKVTDYLEKGFSQTVTNAWSRSTTQKFTFSPKQIHALRTQWSLKVQHATANYFGSQVPITIVADASSSGIEQVSKSSVEELPDDLKKIYKQRNPGT